MKLNNRVKLIEQLFETMDGQNASLWQKDLVQIFRREHPYLIEDLDFCFEVLAGKHKLGFTLYPTRNNSQYYTEMTIRQLVESLKECTELDKSDTSVLEASQLVPIEIQSFMIRLLNRVYRLGYTNRNNMVTDKHCMLAKSYPNGISNSIKQWYVQEKLNGNRCIAYFEDGYWQFISRSQKPMKVRFDMVGFDIDRIYDGEIMSRGKMNNRDFSKTSGAINSKYGDKSHLMYFVYDILDDQMSYKDRRAELLTIKGHTSPDVVILKVLDKVTIYPNIEYNSKLDAWLDKIVSQGGEGVMLRDPDAPYYHSKHSGDRNNYLLKYKKTQTCELRIVGWNEGKSKYEGMIGSFICESDDKRVKVSVAGITDSVRMSNPDSWIGQIIEVAYFDWSRSNDRLTISLQHPRMKLVRDDKTETTTVEEITGIYELNKVNR